MVLNQDVSDAIRLSALTQFDTITHIGFSDDTNDELASSDTLTGEFIRKALSTGAIKDVVLFTEDFEAILTLTDSVGETVAKIGLFTDLDGNTLEVSTVLPASVSKTADNEISVVYQIATEVQDLT